MYSSNLLKICSESLSSSEEESILFTLLLRINGLSLYHFPTFKKGWAKSNPTFKKKIQTKQVRPNLIYKFTWVLPRFSQKRSI